MSFPSVAGVRYVPFFQVVIPECRSRESVVNIVALFHNNRSPTETFGDDNQSGQGVIPVGKRPARVRRGVERSGICRCGCHYQKGEKFNEKEKI